MTDFSTEVLLYADDLTSTELRELTPEVRKHLGDFNVQSASRDWVRRAVAAHQEVIRQDQVRRLVTEIAQKRREKKAELRSTILSVEASLFDTQVPEDEIMPRVEDLGFLYDQLRRLEYDELYELQERLQPARLGVSLARPFPVEHIEYLYIVLAYLAGSLSKEVVDRAVTGAIDIVIKWARRRFKPSSNSTYRAYIFGPKGEVLKTINIDKKRLDPSFKTNEDVSDSGGEGTAPSQLL